jgi:hypothetical protein
MQNGPRAFVSADKLTSFEVLECSTLIKLFYVIQ